MRRSWNIIIVIISASVFLNSCKKKEKELRAFYQQQSRDVNLVGTFYYYDKLPDSSNFQIWEFNSNGELYDHSMVNDKYIVDKSPQYWYTKDNGVLYRYVFKKDLIYGSWEEINQYSFSNNNDTLLMDNAKFIRQ